MPTEEDLKAIVVHKKYSSSRKGKGESARKRKRSSSSDSSHTSISSGIPGFLSPSNLYINLLLLRGLIVVTVWVVYDMLLDIYIQKSILYGILIYEDFAFIS